MKKSEPGPRIVLCPSCEAPIFWAKTWENARRMPVNASPDPAGSLLVAFRPRLEPVCRVAKPEDRPKARAFYMPHFATCPTWAEQRRGGE